MSIKVIFMLLIADSGGTKTHWRLISDSTNFKSAKTPGINPYYQTSEQIFTDLKREMPEEIIKQQVNDLFFYGAGCSVKEKQETVSSALNEIFKNAKISVYGDLLGTARALCHYSPGIACVIGTGSGSCIYDGNKIINNIPSLGYIMGDEGSGAYLGKRLLQDYLRGDMPQKVITKLRAEFEISKDVVLENVNRRPMPSRYLGSFSEFIRENTKIEYLHNLVQNSFNDFVSRYILKYPDYRNYKTYFTGSIAYHFREILKEVLSRHEIVISNVVDSPMEGLMNFHVEKL